MILAGGQGTYIGSKAKIKDSIIMPGAYVGHSAYIEKAIIGPDAVIANRQVIIGDAKQSIAVVGKNTVASSKNKVCMLHGQSSLEYEPNNSTN